MTEKPSFPRRRESTKQYTDCNRIAAQWTPASAGVTWFGLVLFFTIHFSLFTFFFSGCSGKEKLAGGASESEATIALMSNGEPSVGAVARLIDAENWIDKTARGESVVLDSAFSDLEGVFRFAEEPTQKVNLQIDGHGQGKLVRDFEFAENQTITLEDYSSLSLTANVEEGELVRIHLVGTNYSAAVNPADRHEFDFLPPDSYTVVAKTETNSVPELVGLDHVEISSSPVSRDLNVCGNDGVAEADAMEFLEVENLTNGDTLSHELALLRGTLTGSAGTITSQNASGDEVNDWPAAAGRFKVIVQLDSGNNAIALEAEGHLPSCFNLEYLPNQAGETIQMAVLVGSDQTPHFQGPPGEVIDVASAAKRIALGTRLNQMMTAELMVKAGYDRKTFRLFRNGTGGVEVTVVPANLSTNELRELSDDELTDIYVPLLDSIGSLNNTSVTGILGMTRFFSSDSIQANLYGGAGNSTIIGGGTLHTWAEDLSQLVTRYSDTRRVEDFDLSDHSNGRQEFWANYSSGAGVMMVFIGRDMGANDVNENDAVLARGFDHINRVFMLHEQGEVIEDELIHWSAENAAILDVSDWMR